MMLTKHTTLEYYSSLLSFLSLGFFFLVPEALGIWRDGKYGRQHREQRRGVMMRTNLSDFTILSLRTRAVPSLHRWQSVDMGSGRREDSSEAKRLCPMCRGLVTDDRVHRFPLWTTSFLSPPSWASTSGLCHSVVVFIRPILTVWVLLASYCFCWKGKIILHPPRFF